MAETWNTNTGEAVYRTRDDVKNLKIKVLIERQVSTVVIPQHLQQEFNSQQSEIELQTLRPQSGENAEELVVGWQEKFFSQYEMEVYQDESACQTPLDRQYHIDIKALNKTKSRQNRRIFTYTDHDRHTDCIPQLQHAELLTRTKSTPSFLAERMINVRQRRQERRTTCSTAHKSRMINWEPSEEFVKNTHVVDGCMQTMHIMGDLGAPGRLGQRENECLLVTVRTDGGGTIVIKPDFNRDTEPYRIVTSGKKKEVWRLTIENVSTCMKVEEKDQEKDMYKDLYLRHNDYLRNLVGQDFEMPPAGLLRYVLNGEIVSAEGYEYDNLYIQFFIELPNDWTNLPFQSLTEVTQSCRSKSSGKDSVAFFSYPFNFEAFCMIEKESSDGLIPQWPVIYFKVLSVDYWQRYRTEGYGFLIFPDRPGKHTVTCQTWRPFQTGTVSALRRFFVGGSLELEDHSYIRVPGTFKGERMSRFGFFTESTGTVTFNLHIMRQSRSFADAVSLKKRRQVVMEQLGGQTHHHGVVGTILEAFQRAKKRMQDVREIISEESAESRFPL